MGRQEDKGYKTRPQEDEGNTDKKESIGSMNKAIMWTFPRKNEHKGNDEFVPMIGGARLCGIGARTVKIFGLAFLLAVTPLNIAELQLVYRPLVTDTDR
jgi:hypothetical protein